MEDFFATDHRTGAERRRSVEKRNGLAVLMAGCSQCDRIAPSPAEMHAEGWELVYDDSGLVSITCPAHGADALDDPDALPDYLLVPDDAA